MIRRFHDPDELYDLATDPFEVSPLDLDNLSSDARDGYERLQEWLPFEPEGPGLGD